MPIVNELSILLIKSAKLAMFLFIDRYMIVLGLGNRRGDVYFTA